MQLAPYFGDPDPELRIAAFSALGVALRYHRDRLPEVLTLIRARRNEQDPVRLAMLSGLVGLPPGAWQPDQLVELGQVIREALNAADLSQGTAAQVEKLIIAILPFHPDWSADWLATLVKERGQVSFHDLGERLTVQQVRRVAPALVPVLQSWATREREGYLLAAARSFNRRLVIFDELVEILKGVLEATRNQWIASGILGLFTAHRRDILPV